MVLERQQKEEISHFDGRRYFNPAAPNYGFRVWRVLGWMARRRRARWPKWIDDPIRSVPAPPIGQQLAATFVGQSTFLLQLDGVNILTDPIWSERASPVRWAGPRRVRRPGIAFEKLPPSTSCWSATIITITWTCRRCAACVSASTPFSSPAWATTVT